MSCNQRVRKKITQNASLMQPKKKSHFALENMCIDANSAYSVFNFIFWTMNEHLGLTQPQTLAHEGRFVPNQWFETESVKKYVNKMKDKAMKIELWCLKLRSS